ncbi:cytotoxin [Tumebacillus avium]|uniref:Cytotoxin n=1 Tax=Tumebacillus avium TaxID=1903704 RepID=A0A1Y0IN72_9BACL|nr:cytotoxin [Tumebacillus avium]ARU61276.1 cytotoxin [Tumebacillus avium]
MQIIMTARFEKSFMKLDAQSQAAVLEAIDRLFHQPDHPSLRRKKVQGTHGKVWEISGNMDIRITFHLAKPNGIILRNCGHHDDALKKP